MKKKFLCLFVLLLTLTASIATVTVTAYADEQTVSVTFYLDEVTVYGESQSVKLNGYASVPTTPSKNGSVFLYWSTEKDGDTRFSFATPITADTNLYAVWKDTAKYYTVTFMVDGVAVNVQEVKENGSVALPASAIVPENKVFNGWDKTATELENITQNIIVTANLVNKEHTVRVIGFDGNVVQTLSVVHGGNVDLSQIAPHEVEHYTRNEQVIGNTQNIIADCDIYLEYTPETLTVNFYESETAIANPVSVSYGTPVSMPSSPSKNGYVFIGWYKDLADTEMYNFALPIESGFSLYAKYVLIVLPKFTVTFLNYDGTIYSEQLVEQNSSAIRPGTPFREGYEFVEWDADYSKVTADITVRPIFKLKEYKVTVVDCGMQFYFTVKHGASIPEPEPLNVIMGKEFVGWDNSFNNIKSDLTITAEYRYKTFVIFFYTPEMKQIGAKQYVTFGYSAKIPTPPQIEGYYFTGNWIGDGDLTYVTDDGSFIAEYEKISYDITFVEDGETVHVGSAKYQEFATLYEYTKPADTETGKDYIFVGWYVDATLQILYDNKVPVTKPITLFAKWELEPDNTYEVTYKVDGATVAVKTVIENSDASNLITPQKIGHIFTGWTVDVGNITEVTTNITATANFVKIKYTVIFKYGDGLTKTESVEFEESAPRPENTDKVGYDFVGWDRTDEELNSITANITVNALYTIKTCTVNFYENADSDTPIETQTVNYGSHVRLISAPAKEGHTFLVWTTLDGSTYNFNQVLTFEPNKDGSPVVINLYASYKVNSYEIYYYVNGFDYGEAQIVEYGTRIEDILIPAPDCGDDEEFSGWKCNYETMPARPITITASISTYYSVNYYVNGELFDTVRVLQGKLIPAYDKTPTNLPENIVFVAWNAVPEKMPARDVRVDAQIQILDTYNVYYYVNGELFDTVQVVEGKPIPAFTKTPTDLPITVVFKGWGTPPSTMPDSDVRVDAIVDILKYYNVYYYVGNDLFDTVPVLQGATIPAYDKTPTNLPENIRFDGWETPPSVMPDKDVIVRATITTFKYYIVSYYVNGVFFDKVQVLEGKPIPVYNGVPEDLDETVVFNGWGTPPSVMPSNDVRIEAQITILKYYHVYYYANDVLLEAVPVLEGKPIPAFTKTPEIEGFEFEGWGTIPSVMPSADVIIHAILTEIKLVQNKLELTVTQIDGAISLQLVMTEDVNFAGILGRIEFNGNVTLLTSDTDSVVGDVFLDGSYLNFVWSKGENTTSEVTIFTATVTGANGNVSVSALDVTQISVISADGSIIPVGYNSEIIQS